MNDHERKAVQNPKPVAAPVEGYKGGHAAYEARFNGFVDRYDSGCWEWKGTLSKGYGSIGGLRAHRVAYYLAYGVDPGHLLIRHDCDNKACVNAKHLRLGTQADNMLDAKVRGRSACGERSGNSKLKVADVKELRRKYIEGVPQTKLAAEYGITQPNVSYIARRLTWAHVPDAEAA